MNKEEIIAGLYQAILSFDSDEGIRMSRWVIDQGIDALEAIDRGLTAGIREVGRRFHSGEVYLPELQLAGDVLQAAMDVLNPHLLKTQQQVQVKGKVLIGTVKGDLHNIGKDLVAVLLKANGFSVTDLGVDVPTFTFVEQAVKNQADIIGLSALLTTTLPQQREVIEALKSEGLRDRFKVIIGGGAVDLEWCRRIGADGYGQDAAAAIELALGLCQGKR